MYQRKKQTHAKLSIDNSCRPCILLFRQKNQGPNCKAAPTIAKNKARYKNIDVARVLKKKKIEATTKAVQVKPHRIAQSI